MQQTNKSTNTKYKKRKYAFPVLAANIIKTFETKNLLTPNANFANSTECNNRVFQICENLLNITETIAYKLVVQF